MDKREIYRYLSAGEQRNEALDKAIERAAALAENAVAPRFVYDRKPCGADGRGVTVDGVRFAGASLAGNLKDCRETFLIAVTLGSGADLLLRQETQRGALCCAVMQAVLTERLERECDRVQGMLSRMLAEDELLRPRFSLGYGDTRLTDQNAFFGLLPITKRIGVTLTDGCLMIPCKSVTAFVGIVSNGQKERSMTS